MKQYIKKTALLYMLSFGLSFVFSNLYAGGSSSGYNPGNGGNSQQMTLEEKVEARIKSELATMNEKKYIYYDLRTSIRNRNEDLAPTSMVYNKRIYQKINVDLNEGAGGKRIFLYYTKTDNKEEALGVVNADTWWRINFWTPNLGSFDNMNPYENYGATTGLSFANSGWTNLNQGAGGKYVKLYRVYRLDTSSTFNLPNNVVTTKISVINFYPDLWRPSIYLGKTKGGTYRVNGEDWQFCPVNLNDGAGGSEIYIISQIEPY